MLSGTLHFSKQASQAFPLLIIHNLFVEKLSGDDGSLVSSTSEEFC
jgi:hypothetical protein